MRGCCHASLKRSLWMLSAFCRRLINELKNTRLNRNWHDADTCSNSVELTFSTVTSLAERIVAVRLAPGT